MRILLFGKKGQLGWELNRSLATLGKLSAYDYPEVDLINPDLICGLIKETKPELVVNAAAYTQVDLAESEPEQAFAINQTAPGRLAEACAEIGAAFIHYSTDYVFDGKKGSPYVESDTTKPLNTYGLTKLGGEQMVISSADSYWIFRTSWVYSLRGSSFVSKVLKWARQNTNLRIADDQVGNPTWARMLAEISAQLLAKAGEHPAEWIRERKGLYHLAGDGLASRYEWASEILRLEPHPEEQVCSEILTAKTSDFSNKAERPLFSALNCDLFASTFGLSLPPWEQALRLAFGDTK